MYARNVVNLGNDATRQAHNNFGNIMTTNNMAPNNIFNTQNNNQHNNYPMTASNITPSSPFPSSPAPVPFLPPQMNQLRFSAPARSRQAPIPKNQLRNKDYTPWQRKDQANFKVKCISALEAYSEMNLNKEEIRIFSYLQQMGLLRQAFQSGYAEDARKNMLEGIVKNGGKQFDGSRRHRLTTGGRNDYQLIFGMDQLPTQMPLTTNNNVNDIYNKMYQLPQNQLNTRPNQNPFKMYQILSQQPQNNLTHSFVQPVTNTVTTNIFGQQQQSINQNRNIFASGNQGGQGNTNQYNVFRQQQPQGQQGGYVFGQNNGNNNNQGIFNMNNNNNVFAQTTPMQQQQQQIQQPQFYQPQAPPLPYDSSIYQPLQQQILNNLSQSLLQKYQLPLAQAVLKHANIDDDILTFLFNMGLNYLEVQNFVIKKIVIKELFKKMEARRSLAVGRSYQHYGRQEPKLFNNSKFDRYADFILRSQENTWQQQILREAMRRQLQQMMPFHADPTINAKLSKLHRELLANQQKEQLSDLFAQQYRKSQMNRNMFSKRAYEERLEEEFGDRRRESSEYGIEVRGRREEAGPGMQNEQEDQYASIPIRHNIQKIDW